MSDNREVIAVAGVGNLGKYLCEEIRAERRYKLIVLTRQSSEWLQTNNIEVRKTDYSEESVYAILEATKATALVSFINSPGSRYISIHGAFLKACERSTTCKRLIPSEWIGNVEDCPHLPRFYATTREPFRQMLRESSIQWTLFNGGWLMDYFLTKDKTYMPPIPTEFPVDPNNWKACIRGTGDEPQAWTWSRDIARAVVSLLGVTDWEPVTYVVGEWSTFNRAVKLLETTKGQAMVVARKSEDEIMALVEEDLDGDMTVEVEIAQVEEWMIAGASACPKEKTIRQRKKYFPHLEFVNLEDLLLQAKNFGFL